MRRMIGICAAIVCVAGSAFCDQATEAKAAAERYLATIRKGNTVEIFQLLPKSYQKDVNDIVSLFGKKMDAEVWKVSTDLLGEVAKTAQAQKKLLAEVMAAEGDKKPTPEQLQKAEEQITTSCIALEGLSEVSLDSLKKGDTISLLKNQKIAKVSVSALPEDFDLSKYKISGAKQTEKGVTITISRGKDQTEDIPMVLVDSVWVPTDLADSWNGAIKSAKESISEAQLITPEMKKKILTIAPTLKLGITQMRQAKNKDQLQMGMMGLMMPIMMTFGSDKDDEKEEEKIKAVAPDAKTTKTETTKKMGPISVKTEVKTVTVPIAPKKK